MSETREQSTQTSTRRCARVITNEDRGPAGDVKALISALDKLRPPVQLQIMRGHSICVLVLCSHLVTYYIQTYIRVTHERRKS